MQSALPTLLRPTLQLLLDEIRILETRIAHIERDLANAAAASNARSAHTQGRAPTGIRRWAIELQAR